MTSGQFGGFVHLLVRCLGCLLFPFLSLVFAVFFTHPRSAGVLLVDYIGFDFALWCLCLLCLSKGAVAVVLAFHFFPRDIQVHSKSLYPALSRRPSASSRCQSGKMMTRRGRPSNSTRQHRNTSELENIWKPLEHI